MIAWNVNGLIRKLGDIDFVDTINKFDVIFLSETWISGKHVNNLELQNFESYHIYGQKTRGTNKGRYSGGISVYYRSVLKDHISIVDADRNGIVWLKIDQNLFEFNENVFICNLYIPPKGSKVLRDRDIDFLEQVEIGLERHGQMGKTFIIGDFNSRTAEITDILEIDKYLDEGTEVDNTDTDALNKVLDSIPVRKNKDKVIDRYGKKLLSFCKATNHMIVYFATKLRSNLEN